MAHCHISHLCFSPFWTQLSFQIPTHTIHSLLHHLTPAKSVLCPLHLVQSLSSLSSLELPGFPLLPDSLEFTVVSYHLPESPLLLDNNPQLWHSPHIPSPQTARSPSSTREGITQMGCTTYFSFLISTGPQTLHQQWIIVFLPSISAFLYSNVPYLKNAK